MYKYVLAFAVLITSMGQLTGDQQNTIVGKVTKVDRVALTPIPQERGEYTYARDYAALQWETQTPWIPDGVIDPVTQKPVLKWPIVAYYKNAWYPSIIWYYNGSFRASNGYKWGVPERWSYVRHWKEEWDPARKQHYVPGLDGPESVPADDDKPGVYMTDVQGQWMIDDLKRSFTVNKINKMLEASPYDEPDKGAPLE
jgi:hypothetical protein